MTSLLYTSEVHEKKNAPAWPSGGAALASRGAGPGAAGSASIGAASPAAPSSGAVGRTSGTACAACRASLPCPRAKAGTQPVPCRMPLCQCARQPVCLINTRAFLQTQLPTWRSNVAVGNAAWLPPAWRRTPCCLDGPLRHHAWARAPTRACRATGADLAGGARRGYRFGGGARLVRPLVLLQLLVRLLDRDDAVLDQPPRLARASCS